MDERQVEESILTNTPTVPEEVSTSDPPSRWRENHGNFLLMFVCIILLIGSGVLIYRQNRFVPPRFPDNKFLETLDTAEVALPDSEAITIEVTGAENDLGQIAIAVFDAATSFNQATEAMLAFAGDVENGTVRWRLNRNRLPDRFAVAAYHDQNLDSELNRNQFGIPTERYGFSRDARGSFGPPSFEQAVMDKPRGGETIVINVR
ncbi:MAG: DUF2141 domain-containing protein [Planctomycetota bacterium]